MNIDKTMLLKKADLDAVAEEKRREQINREAEETLRETDWYVLRQAETGVEIPIEIKQLRQEARARVARPAKGRRSR